MTTRTLGDSVSEIVSGSDVPLLYHAGKSLIRKIDPERLKKRDSGYYGEGFYVTFDREYALRWYGPTVSTFKLVPA